MEASNKLKFKLMNHLARFDMEEDEKEQLIAELDVLSNLVIDAYLEYNSVDSM